MIWRALRWLVRAAVALVVLVVAVIALGRWVLPPVTVLMVTEGQRLGGITRDWRDLSDISPDLARAVVAAEDAGFCAHWGLEVEVIREVLESGQSRGASTISQQVAKNVYLWPERSWLRKGLEAGVTLVIEATWPKARILEVYLNVAEMAEGQFGAQAASLHWFGVDAQALSLAQAARIAAILPNPRLRSASAPGPWLRQRAASIADGAETIRRDGRAACFS